MTKMRIYQDRRGKIRWKIVAPNGAIIAASSQGYARKAGCMTNIQQVRETFVFCFPDIEIVDET